MITLLRVALKIAELWDWVRHELHPDNKRKWKKISQRIAADANRQNPDSDTRMDSSKLL